MATRHPCSKSSFRGCSPPSCCSRISTAFCEGFLGKTRSSRYVSSHPVIGSSSGRTAHSPAEDFMRHLHQVRAYLSSIDVASLKSTPTERSGDGEPDRGSPSTTEHSPDTAGGAHGVFAVTDQLLPLSQYLAPEMTSALRVLLHGWKEDGLTVHKCVALDL